MPIYCYLGSERAGFAEARCQSPRLLLSVNVLIAFTPLDGYLSLTGLFGLQISSNILFSYPTNVTIL